jgi:hypothetical protein
MARLHSALKAVNFRFDIQGGEPKTQLRFVYFTQMADEPSRGAAAPAGEADGSKQENLIVKVGMVGDSGVGKSCKSSAIPVNNLT